MPSIPETIPEQDQALIQELLADKPPEFTDLTVTQYEAFEDGVLEEGNHLVIAETGNGKTFIAEAVTKKAIENRDRVAYLVPSVALVGEKHETLTDWLPSELTVNKGYGYSEADVVIATFESFFEAIIRGYAGEFDTVVLDDFHEIYSDHRGPNIEKAISAALDKDMELLGISATIGNPHVIARWLEADLTISSEERAVPIRENPIEKTNEKYATQIARLIRKHRDKGPFLIFNDTTSNAQARAEGVAEKHSFDVPDDVDFHALVENAVSTELTDTHRTLIRLLNQGIAYHHAKMEDGLKELIEEHTEEGVIRCVFCTTTLSYGFDSPVQSVIVSDLKRWDGYRQFIGVYEYVQWIGRAGRSAEVYNEAYAFPLYNDEEASEKFQFDTRVENKDLEDVESHLATSTALQWLILELVNYGWETDQEVLEFVQSTLLWSETVDQVPEHVQDDFGLQPGEKVYKEVEETLKWLHRQGLITKPLGQPQTDETRYEATDLGSALVEYEHSNWFDNSIEDVLTLTEWLETQGADLTPESLIQRIAHEYVYCDIGQALGGDGPVTQKMAMHGLEGSPGTTAVLICWFWCQGIPVTDMQERFGTDLSGLPNTARNLSIAIESIKHLYDPYEMPTEPEWVDSFASQVETGVPGPDMYLVDNVDYFGRVLYNRLTRQLNRMAQGSDWDLGRDHYLIERLSKLLAERNQDLLEDSLRSVEGIGPSISSNLTDCLETWDPDTDVRVEIPFVESFRTREPDEVTRHHESSTEFDDSGHEESRNSTKRTTLDDFGS